MTISPRIWIPLAVLVLAVAPNARADPLGAASGYNVFAFQNYTSSTDSQGPVAVGGDANLSPFKANVNGGQPSGTPSLVVGGNLTLSQGEVAHGDLYVGGSLNMTQASVTGGNVYVGGNFTLSQGEVQNGGKVYVGGNYYPSSTGTTAVQTNTPLPVANPVNFADAQAALTGQSASWGAMATTGVAALDSQSGTLTLTGSNSGLNVFSINASQLGSASAVNITAPGGSTVLVNVTGSGTVNVATNFALNGIGQSGVLFNFGNFSTVNLNSTSFKGSILAPFATLSVNNGNVEGTAIANNITTTNSGEFHYYPFGGGGLPGGGGGGGGGGNPIPAPPGLILGLIGAVGGWGIFRRRS